MGGQDAGENESAVSSNLIGEATRNLTHFLNAETPFSSSLRRALESSGWEPSELLLMDWSKVSERLFHGALALAEGGIVDIDYVYDAGRDSGVVAGWRPLPEGRETERLRALAVQLRTYLADSPETRNRRLNAVEGELGCRFPEAYRVYMVEHDGFLGSGPSGAYVDVWPIHHLAYMNQGSPQRELHPDLVLIGSDGSRELIGFDFRFELVGIVLVQISSYGWEDTVRQADSFPEFLQMVKETGYRFE